MEVIADKAKSHLDDAALKLTRADEKYRRRLLVIRCGLDYIELVVATRATAAKMKAEFPNYAINWSAVFRLDGSQGGTKCTMGLHPDFPVTGRALRALLVPDWE